MELKKYPAVSKGEFQVEETRTRPALIGRGFVKVTRGPVVEAAFLIDANGAGVYTYDKKDPDGPPDFWYIKEFDPDKNMDVQYRAAVRFFTGLPETVKEARLQAAGYIGDRSGADYLY